MKPQRHYIYEPKKRLDEDKTPSIYIESVGDGFVTYHLILGHGESEACRCKCGHQHTKLHRMKLEVLARDYKYYRDADDPPR